MISASAGAVWPLITDVPRMGEWSPECVGAEWLDGATAPALGVRFVGLNRLGPVRWRTTCTIDAFEPLRVFGFVAVFRPLRAATRWRFVLDERFGRTEVTQTFESAGTPGWIVAVERRIARDSALCRGMQVTLERLAAVVA